jgi:hypothetical protein
MKKSKNKSISLSRRQFIGSCAAGVSFLQLAPYLSITGCTPSKSNEYPPIGERKYHPLSYSIAELEKLAEGTYPVITYDYSGDMNIKIIFPGFHSFDKYAFIDPQKRARKKFQYISINKLGWSNSSGRPEIPFLGFLMHIPKFLDFTWDKMPPAEDDLETIPNMLVYPAQVKYFDNINSPDNYGLFEYDRVFYNLNIEPDPEKVVEVSNPFNIGFSKFVLLKVRPLQFNPRKQCIYGYKKVSLNFRFKVKSPIINDYYLETPLLPPHLEYISEHERIIDPWSAKNPDGSRNIELIKGMVDNFEPDHNKTFVKEGSDLLIIYGVDELKKTSLAGPAKQLSDHKIRNMGMTATMKSYPDFLSDSERTDLAEAIKKSREPFFDGNTIHFPALRDVIILGDLDLIPSKYCERQLFEDSSQNSPSQSMMRPVDRTSQNENIKDFYTDYYCSTLKLSENRDEIVIPDIAVGRIPVKNEMEANSVVSNIIHYETASYQLRQNLTFAGYFQDSGKDGYICNGIASTDYLQTLEGIRLKLMNRNDEISIDTIYDIQAPELIEEGLRYRDGESVENPETLFTDKSELKNKIMESFRSGNRIIVHRDHGYMNGWSRPCCKIPDLWTIFESGIEEVPASIIFNINCLSGHFTGEKTTKMPEKYYDCFSEVLIKGPVLPCGIRKNLRCPAVIASVEESPSFHNDWLIRGIFDEIYGGILSRNNSPGGKKKLGEVVNLGKALLFTSMDDLCLNMYESEIYHVLGDPSILI